MSVHHGISERVGESQRVTAIGALVNAVLALAKLVFGWVGNSSALVADGIHSFSDLISDGLVWFAARYGAEEADDNHPYGHARIETLATLALGALLIGVGIGLSLDAARRLFDDSELTIPGGLAIGVALASVLSKELLYRYTMHVAQKHRSKMLEANAWHHRTDALSSIVVLVGVAGALYGLHYLDALAAIVVSVMIGRIGWELGAEAVAELIDTSLDEAEVAAIRESILAVEGVLDVHMLRTRRMGHGGLADVHIQVPGRVSVSEGHQIAENVRSHLTQGEHGLQDVTVHTDAENDDDAPPCLGLPERSQVERDLDACWAHLAEHEAILGLRLHYLSGRIEASAVLDLNHFESIERALAAQRSLSDCVAELPYLASVRFDFRFADAP